MAGALGRAASSEIPYLSPLLRSKTITFATPTKKIRSSPAFHFENPLIILHKYFCSTNPCSFATNLQHPHWKSQLHFGSFSMNELMFPFLGCTDSGGEVKIRTNTFYCMVHKQGIAVHSSGAVISIKHVVQMKVNIPASSMQA